MAKNEMTVIDKDGAWVVHTGAFRLPHALRTGINLEPGVPTKVTHDDWLKGQPTVKACSDPMEGPVEVEMVKVETPLKAAAKPGDAKK